MDGAWLLIETSGRGGRVGLARGDRVVQDVALDPARRHNRDLAPGVATALRNEGLRPADVAGVVVSVGPGSYTGLRVGVMSAKAFAFARGCALIAAPTFAVWAEMADAPAEVGAELDVVSDGLQELVYAQRFCHDGGKWLPANDLHLAPAAAWAATLGAGGVTGPALKLVEGLIPTHAARPAPPDGRPTLAALWAVGRRLQPLAAQEVTALEPLYLRPSSAEEQAARAAKQG